ncbi:class I SAM-dependent methyltransferase [Nannocystis punicea]|uniref:Class I SAM-dependent methyltransferase n=1 Tax=Nannocystis punicea TaxID=2995304 RepID=A0ABY7GXQ2_9BACT|nr:class I SAM-dependent methyltransferase [Nannocystis poenicansa]WAS91755.1 class I SAM-dependent methyltransferase [Nannocystis poenicansa]
MTEPTSDPERGAWLARMGRALAGHGPVQLEFSHRLAPGDVRARGRFTGWLAGTDRRSLAPIAALLRDLGAPDVVLAAQRAEEPVPARQGVAIAIADPSESPEFRFYRHGRAASTLAERYDAWRWRPGRTARCSRYDFHFVPDPERDPLTLVRPEHRDGLADLLADDRFRRLSGFWSREDDGAVVQLDLALPWLPRAGALPGLRALARQIGAPEGPWLDLPIRHLALATAGHPPTLTLYVQAPLRGPWPADEDALQAGVVAGARALQTAVEAELSRLPQLPPPLAPERSELDGFYGGAVDRWRAILGEDLHYHAGIFADPDVDPDDATFTAASRRAVTELYEHLPAGGRIYDVGCGWGGPQAMIVRDLRAQCLGLTVSRGQWQHIRAAGLPVRWGDAESTLPPGRFDAALLLESLSHIRDKERLLQVLRASCRRLVMRVNCQDAAPPGPAFAGSMHMISSAQLRRSLEASGWRIVHWRDRRREALPSVRGWHRRLSALPPTDDAHVEALRTWCARVMKMPRAWADHNPLIEVVAD